MTTRPRPCGGTGYCGSTSGCERRRMTTHTLISSSTMRRVASRAAITSAIVLSACSATGVDAPDVVRPSDLGGATGAATLFAGAYGYFGFGYSWAVEKSGTISDELKYIVNTNETADTRLLPD